MKADIHSIRAIDCDAVVGAFRVRGFIADAKQSQPIDQVPWLHQKERGLAASEGARACMPEVYGMHNGLNLDNLDVTTDDEIIPSLPLPASAGTSLSTDSG